MHRLVKQDFMQISLQRLSSQPNPEPVEQQETPDLASIATEFQTLSATSVAPVVAHIVHVKH